MARGLHQQAERETGERREGGVGHTQVSQEMEQKRSVLTEWSGEAAGEDFGKSPDGHQGACFCRPSLLVSSLGLLGTEEVLLWVLFCPEAQWRGVGAVLSAQLSRPVPSTPFILESCSLGDWTGTPHKQVLSREGGRAAGIAEEAPTQGLRPL